MPEFTWTVVAGAATHELWVNRVDVPVSGVINVTGLTEARFTPTTAMAKGTYRDWVRAVSTTGEISVWSSPVDFSIVNVSPSPNQPSEDRHALADSVLVSILAKTAELPSVGDDVPTSIRQDEAALSTASIAFQPAGFSAGSRWLSGSDTTGCRATDSN